MPFAFTPALQTDADESTDWRKALLRVAQIAQVDGYIRAWKRFRRNKQLLRKAAEPNPLFAATSFPC